MAKKTPKGKKKAATKPAKAAAKRKPAAKAKKKVSAIPKGYYSLTPYLVCRGAAEAMAFYTKAFGAKEVVRMDGPGGSIMHAEMQIGNSRFMLGDENPGFGSLAPSEGGHTGGLMIYLPNVDKAFATAVAAGAVVEAPLTDMFWGDRYGKLKDPYGHHWSLATHVEDVSGKEMKRRMAAMGPPAQD